MKKIFLSLIVISLMLVGCSNNGGKNDGPVENVTDTSVSKGNIELIECNIYKMDESGYAGYDLKLKNNTTQIIKIVTISTQFLDEEGTILNTHGPQELFRVFPGQEFVVNDVFESKNVAKIIFDGYSYYDEENEYINEEITDTNQEISFKIDESHQFSTSTIYENTLLKNDLKIGSEEDLIALENIEVDEEVHEEYKYFKAKVKNKSGEDIKILTLDFVFLDENGNIVGSTHPQEGTKIRNNQSIIMEGIANIEKAKYVYLDSYSYYVDDEYVQKYISNIDKVVQLN